MTTYYYKCVNENNEITMLLTYNSFPNITDPNTIQISYDEYMSIRNELYQQRSNIKKTRKKEE